MATLALHTARAARAVSFATLRGVFALAGGVAPRAAAPLAEAILCAPIGRLRPKLRLADLPPAERFVLDVRGRPIRGAVWRADSRRPTVLLAHGWGGAGLQLGAMVQPLLAAGFAVALFDQPAHGASGGRTSNLPDFAHTLGEVGRFVAPLHAVVAHSLGVPAAMLALARGLPARRIAVLAAPTDPIALIRQAARALWVPGATFDAMMARIERREQVRLADLAIGTLAPMLGATPALVVHDRDDAIIGFDAHARHLAAWRDARPMVTDGLGHHRLLADPAVIGEVVRFVAGD